jgi:hypothetical protein
MNESTDNFLAGRRIFIFQQRGWGIRTGHFLAQRLIEKGCHLGALTFKRSAHQFHLNQQEVSYELIVNHDEIYDEPEKYLGKDDFSLEEICHDLEIDSVWPYVQSLRDYVRSYKDKYYYGYKQSRTDDEIIIYVKACYKLVKKIFDDFKPDVIIAPNFVNLLHIFFNLYGKKLNVPMIRATESKVRGYCILTYDYNEDGGRFIDRFNELSRGADSGNFTKAKEYIEVARKKLIAPLYSDNIFKKESWKSKLRKAFSPYRNIIWYYLKNNENQYKNLLTIDNLTPWYILRDHYTHRRNVRFSQRFPYDDLSKISKYIYFPLQFQPEETIDVLAPHFNNQLEVMRQVAMAAPDDYTVVVKEHPTMIGLRSPAYMEKISRTPNVKFIDYRVPAEEVIRKSDLIINMSGTTLAEAAFLRKPAIQFGNLARTKLLPNVCAHSDFTTLAKKIKEMLKLDTYSQEYEKQLLNFVTAVFDTGSDADYIGLWLGKDKSGMEKLWSLYIQELEYFFQRI